VTIYFRWKSMVILLLGWNFLVVGDLLLWTGLEAPGPLSMVALFSLSCFCLFYQSIPGAKRWLFSSSPPKAIEMGVRIVGVIAAVLLIGAIVVHAR
jgi:hypothetical protein